MLSAWVDRVELVDDDNDDDDDEDDDDDYYCLSCAAGARISENIDMCLGAVQAGIIENWDPIFDLLAICNS